MEKKFTTINDFVTVTEIHYHVCFNGWTRTTKVSVTYASFRDAFEAFVEGRMRTVRKNLESKRDRFSIQLSWDMPVIGKYDHKHSFVG